MFRSLSILPLAILMAIPAAAQMDDDLSRGPSVSVDALVAEALAKSPDLAAARSRQTAAREMERPAAALADPTVEPLLQMADFPNYTIGTEDMSMAGVQISQPLPYPGKRRARAETARAETAQRESEAADVERRLTREVRSLYARLYAIDQEQKSLEAGRELTDLLAATARARYSSGGGEQESLLKAQLQVTRLEEQLEDHHAERRALVAQLNRWLDRSGDSPLGPVTVLPDVPTPSTAAESTRVRMARAAVATAERRLASARLDLKPDLTPSAGLATRGQRGPVLMLNVEIVPQSSATFDAARASYLAGRGDFSNLIEDFNLWLEARVQLARREADRYTAWAGLEALTGGQP